MASNLAKTLVIKHSSEAAMSKSHATADTAFTSNGFEQGKNRVWL